MCLEEKLLQMIESLKMFPRVDRCCCCLSLHTGCYLLGLFTVLQGVSMVKIARVQVAGVEVRLHPGGDGDKAMLARHALCVLQVIAGNLIIFGMFFKIPIYLRVASFVLIADWGGIVLLSSTAVESGAQKLCEFFFFAFFSCVVLHFFKVLWSYCILMEREPEEVFPTDTFPSKMYVRAISPLLDH